MAKMVQYFWLTLVAPIFRKQFLVLTLILPNSTLSLLLTTQEIFVDSVDQRSDCTEHGVSLIFDLHCLHFY